MTKSNSCDKIKKLVINKKITRIPNGAFYCNHSLETIRIPKNVRYIGSKAFSGINLKEVIIEKDYGAPNVIPSGFESNWIDRQNNQSIKITFVNM